MSSCGCTDCGGIMPGAGGSPSARSGDKWEHMPGDLIVLMATGLTAHRQAGPRRPLGGWTRTRLPSGSNDVGESGSPMEAKEGDCGCGGCAGVMPDAIGVPAALMEVGIHAMPGNTVPPLQAGYASHRIGFENWPEFSFPGSFPGPRQHPGRDVRGSHMRAAPQPGEYYTEEEERANEERAATIAAALDQAGLSLEATPGFEGRAQLYPPSGWTTSCPDDFTGSAECNALADGEIREYTLSALSTLGSRAAENVVIRGDADATDEDLLRQAWGVLQNNVDLINWAVCWATGNSNGDHCIVNRISRTSSRVEVRLYDEGTCPVQVTNFYGAVDGTGGRIRICKSGDWEVYREKFTSGDELMILCSVLDLAAAICHELTHVCGRASGDEPDGCYRSYLIENAFRWGLFRRFPAAAVGTCCQGLSDSSLFGSDGISGITHVC